MKPQFSDESWEDFQWWITKGQKSGMKKLLALIKDIRRNGYNCTGQLEPLKGDDAGWYSVHIDKEDRLVFMVQDNVLLIKSCRTHYGDK